MLYVLSSFFLKLVNSVNWLSLETRGPGHMLYYVMPLDRRSNLPGLKGSNYATMKFAGLLHIGSKESIMVCRNTLNSRVCVPLPSQSGDRGVLLPLHCRV